MLFNYSLFCKNSKKYSKHLKLISKYGDYICTYRFFTGLNEIIVAEKEIIKKWN